MVLRRPQPSQGGQSSLYCRRGSSDASGACTMSKSAKIYGTLTLVLIGFPLFLTFWSGASAIMAILLIGAGSYTIAVCRSEEHTSELQSLMRISYAVFCLKKKKTI